MKIREATKQDAKTIVDFIKALAIYEKLEREATATEEKIIATLFGEKRYAECLIAEVEEKAAGFALFFHNYSTFLAKPGIYLEDLFVHPEFRGRGIGKALLRLLAKLALERHCGRLEWSVLDWNKPAIDFYLSIGAKPQSEWTTYRLTEEGMKNLAAGESGGAANDRRG
jgi:GNAT superfamily N-acetyltransferase